MPTESFNLVGALRRWRNSSKTPEQLRCEAVEHQFGNVLDQEIFDPFRPETFDLQQYVDKSNEILEAADMLPPAVRIAWKDLGLKVPATVAAEVTTVGSSIVAPVKSLIDSCLGAIPGHRVAKAKAAQLDFLTHDDQLQTDPDSKKAYFKVLHGVSGYAEPGDLVLYLGPPKSGTSSLLSFLSSASDLESEGEVLYNGFNTRAAGINAHKNLIRYVAQEDEHYPQLTVRETLQFAADCRTPTDTPFCERQKKDRVLLVARTLGIERVLDTVVGDETLRGVSGGEKKRVTIGEMLVGGAARIFCLDNFSKGLDSQTTLDIVRSIKMLAKQLGLVFIVSLQQPSNEVFDQFDSVGVLDSGKTIYFGPREEALPYFEALGFQKPQSRSVPDFLATVSDPAIRKSSLKSAAAGESAPATPEDFRLEFEKSSWHTRLQETINEHTTEAAWSREVYEQEVPKETRARLEKSAVNSKPYQLNRLARRALMLEVKDKPTLLATFVIPTIIGLIFGFMFFRLPLDASGASNRMSLLFLVGVYSGFQALSTTSKKFTAKHIYAKHHRAGFYSAGPFIFASAFSDILLSFARAMILGLTVYFLAGLNLADTGLRFAFFILALFLLMNTMDSYVQMFSVLLESEDVATALMGVPLLLFIVFNGFLIQPSDIPAYFIWIHWISPLRYILNALAINEFLGLTLICAPEELVPPNVFGNLPADSQVCSVGAGVSYLEQIGFESLTNAWKFIDIGILFAMFLVFLTIAALALRNVKERPKIYKVDGQHQTAPDNAEDTSVHARIDAADQKTAYQELSDENEGSESVKDSASHVVDVTELFSESEKVLPRRLTWRNVRYTVPISKNETKLLLDNVTGRAVPGRVVALMGTSGAGKTTLLDVLAQRKTLGEIEGDIEVNGYPQNSFFPRIAGYCEQMDIHMSKQTVREALEFSAMLRLEESIPVEQKTAVVERTLDALDLRGISDKIIGSASEGFGVSSEARKRVTMGVELVADPSILFLDEPTSGLDSRAAMVVMKAIRRAAKLGCAVVCTIHQPSSEIFDQFDDLLLLRRGGQTVFFGELGAGSQHLLQYLQNCGADQIKPGRNPADYMLETIAKPTAQGDDWASFWLESAERRDLLTMLDEDHSGPEDVDVHFEQTRSVGPLVQFRVVLARARTLAWRSPEYNYTRLLLSLVEGILLGVIFLQPERNQAGSAELQGALFLTLIPATSQITNVIGPTFSSRAVFYRETSSGAYGEFAFFLASGIVELPYTALAALLFNVPFFFLIGFEVAGLPYYLIASVAVSILCVYIGQFLSWICPTQTIAASVSPVVNILGNILSGFLIRRAALPPFFAQIYWINPFQYYLTGIYQNDLEGETFFCETEEFVPFPRPDDLACTEIGFAADVVVDLPQTVGTDVCGFCPSVDGDETLEILQIGNYNKWFNIAIVLGFAAVFRIMSYLALRFVKHNDR